MRWMLKDERERYQYDTLAEGNLQPVFIVTFENIAGQQVSVAVVRCHVVATEHGQHALAEVVN